MTQYNLPKGEVTVVAFVRAKGGKEAKIVEVTEKLQQQVHTKNPGATVFQAYKGANEPGLILFYETYHSRAAFESHKNSDHLQDWFDAIAPLSDSKVEVMVLDPLN